MLLPGTRLWVDHLHPLLLAYWNQKDNVSSHSSHYVHCIPFSVPWWQVLSYVLPQGHSFWHHLYFHQRSIYSCLTKSNGYDSTDVCISSAGRPGFRWRW
jgi:hypothetical protein